MSALTAIIFVKINVQVKIKLHKDLTSGGSTAEELTHLDMQLTFVDAQGCQRTAHWVWALRQTRAVQPD